MCWRGILGISIIVFGIFFALRFSTYHRGNNQGQHNDDYQEGNENATPIALIRIAGNQLEEKKKNKKKGKKEETKETEILGQLI